jgi:hypothetical protein
MSVGGVLLQDSTVSRTLTQSITVSNGVTYTFSFFVKVGDGVLPNQGSGSYRDFTLTVNNSDITNYTAIINNHVGNGVYRCTFTFVSNGATVFNFRKYSGLNNNTPVVAFGFQLEAGAFATPYIPTVAAQVTRVADSAVMTGVNFSSWFNPEQGTLFVDATNVGQNIASVSLNDGTTSNRINFVSRIAGTSTGDEYAVVVTPAGGQASLTGQAYTTDSKSSISYKFNEIRATMNGNTPGLDSTAVLPIVNRLAIGAITTQGSIYIKRLTYYPQALTAANLQAITR